MSPSPKSSGSTTASFPRMSGDEPDYVSGKMEGIKFSPHERG